MNPRKLTAERFKSILEAIQEGQTITSACKLAKIGRSTFYRELETDRDKWDTIKKAETQRDLMITDEAVNSVHSAFKDDWRAAAWWLERNHPDRFSLRSDFRPKPRDQSSHASTDELMEMLAHSAEFRSVVRQMLEKADAIAAS